MHSKFMPITDEDFLLCHKLVDPEVSEISWPAILLYGLLACIYNILEAGTWMNLPRRCWVEFRPHLWQRATAVERGMRVYKIGDLCKSDLMLRLRKLISQVFNDLLLLLLDFCNIAIHLQERMREECSALRMSWKEFQEWHHIITQGYFQVNNICIRRAWFSFCKPSEQLCRKKKERCQRQMNHDSSNAEIASTNADISSSTYPDTYTTTAHV